VDGNLRGVVADVIFNRERFNVTLENGLHFHLSEAPGIGESISLAIDPQAVECLS
jgi:hypothetical protein